MRSTLKRTTLLLLRSRLHTDAVPALTVWPEATANMVNSHVENITNIQRDVSSVDGVIFSSQKCTEELLASTNDSIANSYPFERHRVVTNSGVILLFETLLQMEPNPP